MKRGTHTSTIITDKSSNENAISSKIDNFFSAFSIYKIMKSSNFYKESGVQPVEILKQLFGLIFSGKNLYQTLDMNPSDVSFKNLFRILQLIPIYSMDFEMEE